VDLVKAAIASIDPLSEPVLSSLTGGHGSTAWERYAEFESGEVSHF